MQRKSSPSLDLEDLTGASVLASWAVHLLYQGFPFWHPGLRAVYTQEAPVTRIAVSPRRSLAASKHRRVMSMLASLARLPQRAAGTPAEGLAPILADHGLSWSAAVGERWQTT